MGSWAKEAAPCYRTCGRLASTSVLIWVPGPSLEPLLYWWDGRTTAAQMRWYLDIELGTWPTARTTAVQMRWYLDIELGAWPSARTTAVQMRYFLCKVNIWYVNCARATAFIFDTRTGVLVKVSKFLRQKMSRPEGDSNPQPSDSCRML